MKQKPASQPKPQDSIDVEKAPLRPPQTIKTYETIKAYEAIEKDDQPLYISTWGAYSGVNFRNVVHFVV
jgi:hypothetical protein